MSNPPPPTAAAAATTPRLYPNQPVTRTPIHHFSAGAYRQLPHPNYPHIAPRMPAAQGVSYPLGSSGVGRGLLQRSGADPGACFPPRPYGGNPARVPYGMHLIRPAAHMQHNLHGTVGAVKGIPVSSLPKVGALPSSGSDRNGYKDTRDMARDESSTTVRNRKVRIIDGASLYAQCRSWLRNGLPEESQPQYLDGVKSLPRPLPIPVGDIHSSKKDGDKEEEDERDVGQLSSKELLQTHIKRAKRVRARLREERLQRIARYKTRLALLLPPIVEQQLRNDTTTGQ